MSVEQIDFAKLRANRSLQELLNCELPTEVFDAIADEAHGHLYAIRECAEEVLTKYFGESMECNDAVALRVDEVYDRVLEFVEPF